MTSHQKSCVVTKLPKPAMSNFNSRRIQPHVRPTLCLLVAYVEATRRILFAGDTAYAPSLKRSDAGSVQLIWRCYRSVRLAEAQTRYVSATAMLDAHDRELQRTQKLVEIGAASRQKLEKIHAEHAAQTAAVQSARSQLELLGVSASALENMAPGHNVSATTNVSAPIDGVVTERGANVGLNVDTATKMFTVVDLSTVWVVANLYEKDSSRVRVGSEAAITTSARPDVTLRGRVSYIDPQVSADTRTARVRIEVPNPGRELRLGIYTEVVVAGASGKSAPRVPRNAVQNVGDRTVVYLANPKEPGKFVEREVRLGQTSGEQVEVVSGVQPGGNVVVTGGSFFVRAERERLGLRPAEVR